MRKFIKKVGTPMFILFVVLYLIQRDYPFGNTFQTITDIALFLAIVLIIIDEILKRRD